MTQLFNSGQVGMCIDAIALYQTLVDPNESAFYDKVGVAPIPEGPAGRQSYKQVVWGASIYSGSKNKEAAWEFLKYAAGKDVAAEITPRVCQLSAHLCGKMRELLLQCRQIISKLIIQRLKQIQPISMAFQE